MQIPLALLSTVVPIALIVIGVMVIVRGLSFPLGLGKTARPVCGSCKHEIARRRADQEGMGTCPECGTDYETGGVLTRALAFRHRPGTAAVLLSVTFFALVGFSIVSGVLMSVNVGGMQLTRFQRDTTLHANRDDAYQQTGAPGYSIDMDSIVEAKWNGPAVGGVVTMTINADGGGSSILVIDLPDLSWRGVGTGGDDFDTEAVRKALSAAGVNTDPPYITTEAQQLVDAIQKINASPELAFNGQVPMYNNPAFPPVAPTPN